MSASDELLHRNIDKEATMTELGSLNKFNKWKGVGEMTDPKCLNCGKSILEGQGFCQKKGMRDRIAGIMVHHLDEDDSFNDAQQLADQILSLTHDEWEMVEGCPKCHGSNYATCLNKALKGATLTLPKVEYCGKCKSTGKITRPATIDEVLNDPRARRKEG